MEKKKDEDSKKRRLQSSINVPKAVVKPSLAKFTNQQSFKERARTLKGDQQPSSRQSNIEEEKK